jgi:hypothetical protein
MGRRIQYLRGSECMFPPKVQTNFLGSILGPTRQICGQPELDN